MAACTSLGLLGGQRFWGLPGSTKIKKSEEFITSELHVILGGEIGKNKFCTKKLIHPKQTSTFPSSYKLINVFLLINGTNEKAVCYFFGSKALALPSFFAVLVLQMRTQNPDCTATSTDFTVFSTETSNKGKENVRGTDSTNREALMEVPRGHTEHHRNPEWSQIWVKFCELLAGNCLINPSFIRSMPHSPCCVCGLWMYLLSTNSSVRKPCSPRH